MSIADRAQPAILQPVPSIARALTFRLAPGCRPAEPLRRLRDALSPERAIVGLGAPLTLALGVRLAGLRAFPGLAGVGCAAPSTQQALWVQLRHDTRGDLFDLGNTVNDLLGDGFILDDAIDTFRYRTGHDLSGYEDGTENPDGDEAVEAAIVAEGDGLAGSSFVAVQRWVHDLTRLRGFAHGERDDVFGRRLETNEEYDEAPVSAHVKRSAQESFEPAAFMVRRSMPWVGAREQGLEFIAFGESLDRFERVMSRMLGLEDGTADGLFTFSRPVTGSYYWCPPVTGGRLDLRAIGL